MDILERAWSENPSPLTLDAFRMAVASGVIRYYVSTNGAMGLGIRVVGDDAYLCYVFRDGPPGGLRADFRECMRCALEELSPETLLHGVVENTGRRAEQLIRFYGRALGAEWARIELTNRVSDVATRLG